MARARFIPAAKAAELEAPGNLAIRDKGLTGFVPGTFTVIAL